MSCKPLECDKAKEVGSLPHGNKSSFDVLGLMTEGHSKQLYSGFAAEQLPKQQSPAAEGSLHVSNLWDNENSASPATSNTTGLRNILSIPGDTTPKLTNNTFGSGASKSASLSEQSGTVKMTETGANADEMWYSHYKDNGGNTISDQVKVTLPTNLQGVHAVEMGAVAVRNGHKDEFELQFKGNGNGTDTMSYFSNDAKLGPHGGWVKIGTVPALHGGTNTIDFTGQILNSGSDLKFTGISVNGQNVATPAEFRAGSASGWGLAGQIDQHMQIDNNSSTAPVTTEWSVSSSQTA